jgi:hypothetical protein
MVIGSPVLKDWPASQPASQPAGLLRGIVPASLANLAGIVVEDREVTLLSSRTPVGDQGASWVRPVTTGAADEWLAAVWVRDLDGRRRLVQARRPGRREAEPAREEPLTHRRPLGSRGAEPNMIVQKLGEYWMRRRREEARAPSVGERRGEGDGVVSLQTLAGYQSALSRIINPRLGSPADRG